MSLGFHGDKYHIGVLSILFILNQLHLKLDLTTQGAKNMQETAHEFSFGEYTGYVLWEGTVRLSPTKVVFAGADEGDLKRDLDKHGIASDGIDVPVHVLLLEGDDRRILIDTGAGVKADEKGMGKLFNSMVSAGLSPESVTDVIITHVHFDHTGGLLDGDGKPAFPNATYWMPKGAHQHWIHDLFENDPDAKNDAYTVNTHNTIKTISPQLKLFSPPDEILDGIQVIPTYGHTANHVSVIVKSAGETLLITSDTLVNEIHIDYPDWIPMWSTDQNQARESTKKILQLASDKNALVYACHLKFPGLGHVASDDDNYIWKPQF